MNDLSPHRIAVIHTGAIGDLVQTGPLLGAVRAKWPEARVTLVGLPERGRHVRVVRSADGTMEGIETPAVWAAVRKVLKRDGSRSPRHGG